MPILFKNSDSFDRSYAVYAPRRWALFANNTGATFPIVFVFHGGNGTIEESANTVFRFHTISTGDMTGLQPVPNDDLFITVYVSGSGFYAENVIGEGYNSGNIGSTSILADFDAVDAVAEILARVKQQFRDRFNVSTGVDREIVDANAQFLVGFSNGGAMVYRLLAEMSVWRAAAVFSGAMNGKILGQSPAPVWTNEGNAVPVYHWHHDADTNVKPDTISTGVAGTLNQSDASTDNLQDEFGLTSAEADYAARRDAATMTQVEYFVQQYGGISTAVPPPITLDGYTTNSRLRYIWSNGTDQFVLDIETAPPTPPPPHAVPRPGLGYDVDGRLEAWSFLKQYV